ncbi:MAG: hypothetical protein KatS3mg105_4918 [Gemmatales bacterium]|nr:MAG: hypothetical protein KatS3mg105_4918 [Gemmatales bacterium]
MKNDQHLRRLIPVTSIWHFYHFLREFPNSKLQLQIARECHRLPGRLDKMIGASALHFSRYDNREESFHSRPQNQNPARLERYAASKDPAKRVAALAGAGQLILQGDDSLGFEYVDYEFGPCRTTRSQHESGPGGYGPGKDTFDLLLVSREDRDGHRLPIIGEIKDGETDRNPFLALIQGLAHVVAMTTEAQRDRLDRSYPGRFDWPDGGPFVDLYLLLINYPSGDKEQEFLELTDKLAGALLEPGTQTSQLVRRIACIDTANDPPTDFSIRFIREH